MSIRRDYTFHKGLLSFMLLGLGAATGAGAAAGTFEGYAARTAFVPVTEGNKLAVDIFLPVEGPEQSSFPVVLSYTPYQRAEIDPATGTAHDLMRSRLHRDLVRQGYAVVMADMRGTGASTGWLLDFMPAIWDDGKALVDWIAAQPWCDGNVGMQGGSYLGWSQTATASRKPAALKCIVPCVILLEGYTGEVCPGGMYLQGFLNLWSGFMTPAQRNHYVPGRKLPTKPAVDEDGDGELADEIPLDQDGNGTFLNDGFPPKYADGAERKHVYFLATREHEKDYDYSQWAKDAPFVNSKSPLGYTMYDLGPNAHVEALRESHIPIYNVGGWFDGFTRGTFELYCTLQDTNPSKAIVFPGYHDVEGGPYYEYLGEARGAAEDLLLKEHLRFYDRYLKGVDNGIDREPPLLIYVMHGGGWRQENEWPLAREARRLLYFAEDHTLRATPGPAGKDEYRVDYTHDSRYGENNGNRWMGIGGNAPSSLPVRTEKDKQCLVYTSAPLDADTEVTGHPLVKFWVSSTAPEGDSFVYLEEVSPEGEAMLVTEGQLRAGFAKLHDNDDIIRGGNSDIEVLPELPWHGFEQEDFQEGIFAGGAVVEVTIDLLPTSWVFRKGHSIRIAIACADFPTFRLNERLCPTNSPADPNNAAAAITIYRDASRPSRIDLPVVR
ncbi:MAG: CocE/NonD family hydrolase [Candidatus Hydrogenedentes bacterium]|nr:CocE/NonD family hydrolase [Candidatus Hydrogenedentota bacterium]